MSPLLILAASTALCLVLFLGLLGWGLYAVVNGPRAKLRRRILQVTGAAVKGKGMAKAGGPLQRRQSIQSKLKDLESARQRKRGYKLREELTQAGLAISVNQFIVFSAVAAGLAAVLGYGLGAPPLITLAMTVTAGVGLPRLIVRILVNRRIKRFTGLFADAIDVIVRGIRSGLPVGECFTVIAREMPDPVGIEFRQIVEGQRLGLTFNEALDKATERVPTAELRFFAIVLAIQQTTGGNLAETLAKLSEVLRARKRMRDKVQAMSSEAKSSAGIIGSLPIIVGLLLSVVAPDYIAILFTTGTGHLILFIGTCTMATGVFVMRQMINFDI